MHALLLTRKVLRWCEMVRLGLRISNYAYESLCSGTLITTAENFVYFLMVRDYAHLHLRYVFVYILPLIVELQSFKRL